MAKKNKEISNIELQSLLSNQIKNHVQWANQILELTKVLLNWHNQILEVTKIL